LYFSKAAISGISVLAVPLDLFCAWHMLLCRVFEPINW